MIKTITFLSLFACLILFSCDPETETPQSPTYDEGVTFTLEFDETSVCSCDAGPEVSFLQMVDDSRCPSNAICVWEGQVVVKLNFNEQEIELANSASTSAFIQRIDTVGQWSIELLEVRPYPEELSNLPEESEYELDLVVRGI